MYFLRNMSLVAIRTDRERTVILGKRLEYEREAFEERQGERFHQKQAAELLGMKPATYRAYEYGRSPLPERMGRKLAAHWGIAYERLVDVDGPTKEDPGTKSKSTNGERPKVEVPFVGLVGANLKVEWLDPLEDVFETEPVPDDIAYPDDVANPEDFAEDMFCCKIVGDSCYDTLWPDDYAYFKKLDVPRINQLMVYRSPDHKVTVKQVRHNGRELILHPTNPAYADEVAQGKFVGYLVGIVRRIGSKKVIIAESRGIIP